MRSTLRFRLSWRRYGVGHMVEATGGRRIDTTVRGPLGDPVEAFYGLEPATAPPPLSKWLLQAATPLVPRLLRNLLTWKATAQAALIRSALDAGARRTILGIGGSATNEGGAGMLQAR